jgi:hypothetical protein
MIYIYIYITTLLHISISFTHMQLWFNGFIRVCLGTTTLGLNHKSSLGQFQNAIYLAHSEVKRMEKCFFRSMYFYFYFLPTPYSQVQYLIH